MNVKILNYSFENLELDFAIEDDKRIYLLYVGKKKSLKPISKNNRNFRNFVEADIAEDNRNTHHGLKLIETSFANTNKYVSHRIIKTNSGSEFIIVTANEFLEIETHYVFYKDCDGLSSFNIVKNISKKDVTLTSISSFVYNGFSKANNKHLELYQADNSWNCEAQWKKDSFLHLGIYNGNNYFANKRFTISNCGSWSTKDHLPMMVINDKLHKNATLIQIENNGSWHLEIGDNRKHLYYLACGPEFYDHQWKKILNPNETFISAQATITFGEDFEKTIQEITKIRRKYRRFSKDNENLPVIFNDYMHALWDKQTTADIKPLVDIASQVGCEIFCMDAGWFAEGISWWDILGNWEEYEPNFPNGGLKALCDYIRQKGMKPGLWFEPEAVGINSPKLKDLPDGFLFKVNNQNSVHQKRYTLNFANPEVFKYMLNVVNDAINKYGLAYIKLDYNTDAGVGNEYDSDSLGDGLLKHNRAYINWLKELFKLHPDLIIENCGSGGCRMDNEILKYCSIQSTSDQTDFRKYPYLSANVLTATTPEQAAVWSYPVNAYIKNYMPTDEEVVMNMANAMLGRIHLASYINKLPNTQIELIKEGIRYFKAIRSFKKTSLPIFPKGTAKFFDKEVVGGLLGKEKIILGVWNTSNHSRTIKIDLSKYNIKDIKVGYPRTLPTNYTYDNRTNILTVTFSDKYGARIFELELY